MPQVSTRFKHEVSGLGRNSSLEETFSGRGRTDPRVDEITENEQLYLVEIERLLSLQERIQNLKNTLLTCKGYSQMLNKTHPKEPNVVYVPVAEIKEKRHAVLLQVCTQLCIQNRGADVTGKTDWFKRYIDIVLL